MKCAVFYPCPSAPTVTVYDAMVMIHGENYATALAPKMPGPGAGDIARAKYRKEKAQHDQLIQRQKETPTSYNQSGPVFACSSKKVESPHCACGHMADFLCDYPMGRGKTCDLNLCWCCRKHLNNEQDLCQIHFAEFVKKTGATQLNLWPPPRPTSR